MEEVANTLIQHAASVPEYPQEDWGFVGSTVVVGLLVVFAVLAILICVFWVLGKIMSGLKTPAKTDNAPGGNPLPGAIMKKSAPASYNTNNPNNNSASSFGGINGEVVAAITAAVSDYGASSGKTLRVRGIQKSRDNKSLWSAWRKAGVRDDLNN